MQLPNFLLQSLIQSVSLVLTFFSFSYFPPFSFFSPSVLFPSYSQISFKIKSHILGVIFLCVVVVLECLLPPQKYLPNHRFDANIHVRLVQALDYGAFYIR